MEINSIPDLKRVAFIGNFLPRQCGIATFTTDLSDAEPEDYALSLVESGVTLRHVDE